MSQKERIKRMMHEIKKLNEEELDAVENAIKSCQVVQYLKNNTQGKMCDS